MVEAAPAAVDEGGDSKFARLGSSKLSISGTSVRLAGW